MKMVSMKMSAKEKKKMTSPLSADGPGYPCGLVLRLEKEQIQALGIGKFDVGQEVMVHAKGKVTSVSASNSDSDAGRRSCELQITDIAIRKAGKDDYDAGWDEAGEELEREGVKAQ